MNAPRRIATMVFVLAAVARAASAADDGGTVGVFATGAGNRALAMGGASVAMPEGPWGWTWNPGGLAWMSRAGAELMQGAPDAIGARETQAAVAVPDWRWGTLALTWRQFGVDDIDGRDDRGAPTSTFDDRETEIGLAYARAATPALGLGGALKMRRHSLAGRSGGGVGADIGASFRFAALETERTGWWRDLVLGARLANVVKPAVRLDYDEVAEPTSWSTGAAWERSSGTTRFALAADLEQVVGGSARTRIGAEIGVFNSLDLRTGWDGRVLTAGTSLEWRGLDVAYTYRDNPLGAEQRVGLGWRFGPTVGEAREHATAAREEEIQKRLQVAFDADLERRTQELIAETRRALADGALDEAWDRASMLVAIAPNRPESAELMASVLAARAARLEQAGDWDGARVEYEKALALAPGDSASTAGAARCREASDRVARRGAEQRRLYDGALSSIAAGDPIAARASLDSLRASGVPDSSLAPLQLRLERLTSAKLEARLEQFQQLLQAGLLDDAGVALERARALAPASPAVARAKDQLARARAAQRPVASAPAPQVQPVSEAARREADDLYQSGLSAQQAGRNEVAVRSWELAILKDPQHARAREALKREYQTRGLDAFSAGRLSTAVEHWQRALQLDPTDARTRSYLDRAQEHLMRSAELGVSR